MRKTVKKVLTFRASSIGDCLMGAYFLENMHVTFPNARYGIVVGSRAGMIRDVLAAYPWIEIIEVNRKNPKSIARLFKEWYGTDITLTQYAGKGGMFSLASKIVARCITKRGGLVGFSDPYWGNGLVYDKLISFSPIAPAALERSALSAVNVPVEIPFPILAATSPATASLVFVPQEKNYAVVHLFPGSDTRGLSPERRHELICSLNRALGKSVTLLLSGAKGDAAAVDAAIENTDARSIAGKVTLQELMNILQRAVFVISVDTGVAHMSVQMGVPLVVLRTCMGDAWWSMEQYGNPTNVFQFSRPDVCGHPHYGKVFPTCINDIDFDEVIQTAKTFLQ
jgi:ADP-heptose:LPS heptosyltransferase